MKLKDIIATVKEQSGISELNDLQKDAISVWKNNTDNIVMLSPTGTGKTLAFAIPALMNTEGGKTYTQTLIISPTRELALQIENVMRKASCGIKITCCYGGHNVLDEKKSLSIAPEIIISTPGRLLDHIHRRNVDIRNIRNLVLDEFDKALELGFENDMRDIMRNMGNSKPRIILTSATSMNIIPDYVKAGEPKYINYLQEDDSPKDRTSVAVIISESKDKLDTLYTLLRSITDGKSIIFANHRESAERIHQYLKQKGYECGLYHGGLEQADREKALCMFSNGSHPLLCTTDLAARGIDIPDVQNIIHYNLPLSAEIYTHRNGRTARIDKEGNVYVICGPEEKLPEYIEANTEHNISDISDTQFIPSMKTIYISAGKKEKISKGDIVGYLIQQGGLESSDIGNIDLKDHYAYTAITASKADDVIAQITKVKLKGKSVRISLCK